MAYYTTVGAVQAELAKGFHELHRHFSVPQALYHIYQSGKFLEKKPHVPTEELWSRYDDDEFIRRVNELPIGLDLIMKNEDNIQNQDNPIGETLLFALNSDVIVFRAFNYINNDVHRHDFFEMGYLLRGQLQMQVEKEMLNLHEGQFYIIGPNARHAITMDDDTSVLICIDIRKSTFENSFFNLMATEDLLSYFFQSILARPDYPNYMLFTTQNEEHVRSLIKTLTMENYIADSYYNICCISLINLLMSVILRNYSDTIQFYSYDFLSARFPLIMRYIQNHYQTVTLRELAQQFHYNETYLSTLIRKNAGMSFSTLLNKLKTGRAKNYLETSAMSIQDISEAVGYSSADHFSRTFKKFYHCSPRDYRLNLQNSVHG